MNKMKRKSIISVLLLGMMGGMFSTSCQDMLSPDSERHSYTVASDTLYSYWGILKSLQNIAERYVILNECRGDFVDESAYVSDTIGGIVNFGEVKDPENWKDGACVYLKISDYYHIINSCNAYIAMCDTTLTTGTNKKYMLKEYAQVQSIRAWVYMQLLYAYGENRVPFYKEPMLTTDDINNFMDDENHPKVSAQLLAQELGPDLEDMEVVEKTFGLPEYNNYGSRDASQDHFVCHSSRCMFPVSIVLGDLYLLSGRYRDAAQHYYNYINSRECGPLPVNNFYCTGQIDDTKDYHLYDYTGVPYLEKNAVSSEYESITCIPSNRGKLEGKVLTDINRLFGFEATLRTSSGGSADASVSLSLNYERELIPSQGYEALCDSQKYEIYQGNTTSTGFDWTTCELVELKKDDRPVGDARRVWIYQSGGAQWRFYLSQNDTRYGKMVAKQNPNRQFSTTYPVIYRKSMVWLRYAEALNRAGFPAYAFAILKTGLCNCNNSTPDWGWFPEDPRDTYARELQNPDKLEESHYAYPVKDNSSIYCYDMGKVDGKEVYLPTGWTTTNRMYSLDELKTWLTTYFQAEYEASLETDTPMDAPRTVTEPFEKDPNVRWAPVSADVFQNIPSVPATKAACYYIPLRERQEAANTPFLNFKDQTYLLGQSSSQIIFYKEYGKLFSPSRHMTSYDCATDPEARFTIGIHQRGCGFICHDLDDEDAARSSYNYVDQVGKKLRYEYGISISPADLKAYVYNDANAALVQNAVEDLIIDEMGLELAFEGTRFSDLCRVAMRRGDNDYLAKRVSKRHTGEIDERLRSKLKTRENWFLPIPEE